MEWVLGANTISLDQLWFGSQTTILAEQSCLDQAQRSQVRLGLSAFLFDYSYSIVSLFDIVYVNIFLYKLAIYFCGNLSGSYSHNYYPHT